MTHKTSHDKFFPVFKKECLRLQKLYGLQRWGIRFYDKLKDKNLVGASIHTNLSNYQADIRYDTGYHHTAESARQAAKHEMCHLLIRRLFILARARYTSEEEIDEAEEELTRTLEFIL